MAAAPKPTPPVDPKAVAIKNLRDQRDQVNAQIIALQAQAKHLSVLIRDVEGPIPDRSGRPAKALGYTMAPAAKP